MEESVDEKKEFSTAGTAADPTKLTEAIMKTYTFSGTLYYLQSLFGQIQEERDQWDVQRRFYIAQWKGELKEKQRLLSEMMHLRRRIGMLEMALKKSDRSTNVPDIGVGAPEDLGHNRQCHRLKNNLFRYLEKIKSIENASIESLDVTGCNIAATEAKSDIVDGLDECLSKDLFVVGAELLPCSDVLCGASKVSTMPAIGKMEYTVNLQLEVRGHLYGVRGAAWFLRDGNAPDLLVSVGDDALVKCFFVNTEEGVVTGYRRGNTIRGHRRAIADICSVDDELGRRIATIDDEGVLCYFNVPTSEGVEANLAKKPLIHRERLSGWIPKKTVFCFFESIIYYTSDSSTIHTFSALSQIKGIISIHSIVESPWRVKSMHVFMEAGVLRAMILWTSGYVTISKIIGERVIATSRCALPLFPLNELCSAKIFKLKSGIGMSILVIVHKQCIYILSHADGTLYVEQHLERKEGPLVQCVGGTIGLDGGDDAILLGTVDGSVEVWRVVSGNYSLQHIASSVSCPSGTEDGVRSICVLGTCFAACGADSIIQIYKIQKTDHIN